MISISLCMIVKDEELVLERCLRTASRIADEVIIVDTGSSDRTKEIAKSYTELVFDLPWEDDFSKARNFAFGKASKEYLMWLDADDVISEENIKRFLRLKQELPPETDIVMTPYAASFDQEGRPAFLYYRERIVKNNGKHRFVGKVHEVIPLSGKIFYSDICVEHRKVKEGEKGRNIRIYKKMEEKGERFCARELYYYGRELLTAGEYEDGIRILERFLESKDAWVENQIDGTRQLARCYELSGQKEKALTALLRGLLYDVPRGETCCELGRHFFERKKYDQAVFWYQEALHAKKAEKTGAFIQEECYGFLPAISLCICYDRMGKWEEAEEYNELAGKFQPKSPYYLHNREYFEKRKRRSSP